MEKRQEKHNFQTEVKQLLHLVTHSLYSNKEVFLRELISNASDAADKLKFEALKDANLYEGQGDLKVWVKFDKKAKTVTVRDNGIGMTREEVIENLGTIAKSGTKEFLAALTGNQAKDSRMIGQFGVGFYSSFVVADKVTVKTRRAGLDADAGVVWESAGEGEFTIEEFNKPERGTEVILHFKKDEQEFLDEWKLRSIITKYSDHIMLPIVMFVEKEIEEESADKDKKPKKKKVIEEETINKAKALWTRSKKNIKDEEYQELYKHISHDFDNALTWSHNQVEGKLEYTSLLYIPKRAPFDLWHRDHRYGLKLYVQRVFIMDDAEHLLPAYLRFVRGIVDSNDLPLNVSREILQSNKVIDNIRAGIVKRIFGMLEYMAKEEVDKYLEFWKEFGSVIKEGVGEDFANKDKIANLLRFSTTHTDSEKQNVSLDDYIKRMQEKQDSIYYVTADSFTAAKNSPHLEMFRKKGIEVLLLSDRIDEWLVAHLTEYDGKQLRSVARGDADVDKLEDKDEQEHKKSQEQEYETVIKQIKEVLGDKVKDVRLTTRLTDSPACLVADEAEMSGHLRRLMEAAGQKMLETKPIFELNGDHQLLQRLKAEQDDAKFGDLTKVLFDQALLAEGGQLEDPASFVKKMNELLVRN